MLTATSATHPAAAADHSGGMLSQLVTAGLGTAAADADGDGQVTLKELFDWARPRAQRQAQKAGQDQQPAVFAGAGAGAADVVLTWGVAR